MGHRLTRFLGLLLLFQTMAVPALWTSVRASEANKAPPTVLKVDVFWSMRSPYCYIALDRILEMQKKYNVRMNLRPVWPIAIWDPEFFKGIEYMKYRVPYQDIDTLRSAQFNDVPYKYPAPDPVLQEPDFGPVKPFKEQVLIQKLTRTAVAAAEMGKGWDYLNQVSRMMWNGMVSDWDKDNHLRDAISRAGIDADALIDEVMNKNPEKYDALIERNHKMQQGNLAGHTGVPNFVFNQEPFFGQDRMDQLFWRLKQYGLTEREHPQSDQ
jgi:2-hydroxychromene-2-carboxylate isomerase